MKYTQNYNLRKPEDTDPADIQDLNYNADAIDGVAPYAGAWIEIRPHIVQGLHRCEVAPYAGAWIEILRPLLHRDH